MIAWSLKIQVLLRNILLLVSLKELHAHDALISNNHLFVGLNLAVTPKSLNELWRILIRQLNIHENNVKRSSLDLITKLLVAGRIPSQNVRNNLPYYLPSTPLL